MPQYFKVLATIAVWVLFLSGVIATLMAHISRLVSGQVPQAVPEWGIGVACLFLSVVAMKLRKMLE